MRGDEYKPLYKEWLCMSGVIGFFAYTLGPLFLSICEDPKNWTQEEFWRSVAIYYSILAVLTLNVLVSALGVFYYRSFVRLVKKL